jgi:hypothetical protein
MCRIQVPISDILNQPLFIDKSSGAWLITTGGASYEGWVSPSRDSDSIGLEEVRKRWARGF